MRPNSTNRRIGSSTSTVKLGRVRPDEGQDPRIGEQVRDPHDGPDLGIGGESDQRDVAERLPDGRDVHIVLPVEGRPSSTAVEVETKGGRHP